MATNVGAAVGGIPVDAMPPVHREAYLRAIRKQLGVYGYRPGAGVTGGTRPLTVAIRAYQSDVGLPVDGVATQELLDHLIFVRPRLTVQPRQMAAVAPTVREMTRPESAPPIRLQAPAEAMPSLPLAPVTRTELTPPTDTPEAVEPDRSSTAPGGVISQVQRKLRARGYYRGGVDGAFAPELAAAIARFQAEMGLPVTKVIDAPLLNALATDPNTARSDRSPVRP